MRKCPIHCTGKILALSPAPPLILHILSSHPTGWTSVEMCIDDAPCLLYGTDGHGSMRSSSCSPAAVADFALPSVPTLPAPTVCTPPAHRPSSRYPPLTVRPTESHYSNEGQESFSVQTLPRGRASCHRFLFISCSSLVPGLHSIKHRSRHHAHCFSGIETCSHRVRIRRWRRWGGCCSK